MTWETVYNATLEIDPAIEPITLPYAFQPYYRLIVTAELLTGLGVREPFLGYLRQLLIIPGIGEVKGRTLALTPFQQLFIPSTELAYKLVYQPVQRDFSLTLTIQVESTIVSSGGAADNGPVLAAISAVQTQLDSSEGTTDNGPVLAAISAVQTQLDSWTGNGETTDYGPLFTQILSNLAAMALEQSSLANQVTTLVSGQDALAADLANLQTTDAALTTKVDAILASVAPINQTLNYTSDGDNHGVFYWLGTFYGQHAWINPQSLQVLTTTVSSNDANFSVGLLTNRSGNAPFYSNSIPGSWVAFDLGMGNRLVPNYYSVRHDNEAGYYLRNWKLQGCNEVAANTVAALAAANWTDLKAHVNDTTINGADAWGSWAIAGITTGYRWFRLLSTGVDANNNNYLVLGEVELYGTFSRD